MADSDCEPLLLHGVAKRVLGDNHSLVCWEGFHSWLSVLSFFLLVLYVITAVAYQALVQLQSDGRFQDGNSDFREQPW